MAAKAKLLSFLLSVPIVLFITIVVIDIQSTFANTTSLYAIELLPSVEKTPITKELHILEDRTNLLTIDDVLFADNFTANSNSIPNFGYTSSTYWVKFKLLNQSDLTERLFEIAYPPLHEIEIYLFDATGLRNQIQLGAKYPFENRLVSNPNYVFLFDIQKGEEINFYIRYKTDGSMQMPMYVWDNNGFQKKRQFDFLQMGIFYGVIGIMIIYNLFLYFALRHRSFLFYILFIFCVGLINLSLSGFAYQYVWPESPWWNMRSIVFFLSLGGVFSLYFTKSFLHVEEYVPRARKIFFLFIILNCMNLLLVMISYKMALNVMAITITSMIIFILIVAFACWKRGARQARFFIIGWFVFLVGSMLSILADSAIIPLNDFTRNVWHISFILEVILLSLALADRINILQNEKNQAVFKANESQQLAVENLKRSDALKDEFLAITSHELRTPLYGMIGIAESLKDGVTGKMTKATSEQLDLIIMSGKRLMDLVNNLLDLSKLKHGAMEIRLQNVRIKELIDVVIAICEPLVKAKPVRLVNEVADNIQSVVTDQDHLMQIFYNLIGNAIKFTNTGTITVKAHLIDGVLLVSIVDTGRGMTSSQMSSIFEPFHQSSNPLSRDSGGTGIGLNITKHLINLHGGEVEVESTLGIGTAFTFTFPVQEAVSFNEDKKVGNKDLSLYVEKDNSTLPIHYQHPTEQLQGKILVADDENVNLQVLLNHLTFEGYEVVTANDGEQALKLLTASTYDLVILDVMMPTMSGFEVCSTIRQDYTLTELPVLMLTANNQLQDKLVAFQVGANDYLSKPCDKEELLARVNTLIALRKLTKETELLTTTLEEKVKIRTRELREVNTNLERANIELQRMEKSRTELLSNITHELGTPITLIQSYVEAVNEGIIEKNNPRYLSIIHEKLIMLEHLTRDLFELAKMRSGHMKFEFDFISVEQWYKTIIQLFEYDVHHSNRIFKHDPAYMSDFVTTHGSLYIDRIRLDQVFTNIIRNAVKFTDETHGTIELVIRFSEEMNGTNQSRRCRMFIEINDNGCGISAEELPHIFQRYFRGEHEKSEPSGSGLGLAISKEIVQAHYGELSITSKLGVGSSLCIELPMYANRIEKGV